MVFRLGLVVRKIRRGIYYTKYRWRGGGKNEDAGETLEKEKRERKIDEKRKTLAFDTESGSCLDINM